MEHLLDIVVGVNPTRPSFEPDGLTVPRLSDLPVEAKTFGGLAGRRLT